MALNKSENIFIITKLVERYYCFVFLFFGWCVFANQKIATSPLSLKYILVFRVRYCQRDSFNERRTNWILADQRLCNTSGYWHRTKNISQKNSFNYVGVYVKYPKVTLAKIEPRCDLHVSSNGRTGRSSSVFFLFKTIMSDHMGSSAKAGVPLVWNIRNFRQLPEMSEFFSESLTKIEHFSQYIHYVFISHR